MQIKALIKFVVLAVSICFLVLYLYENSTSFEGLSSYSIGHAIIIAMLYVTYFLVNSCVLLISVRDYAYKCEYLGVSKIAFTSSLLSYAGLFKLGSIGYKVVALVDDFGVSVKDCAGIILISAYFSTLLNLLVTIGGAVFLQSLHWLYVPVLLIPILGFAIMPFMYLQTKNARLGFIKILNKRLFSSFKVSSVWVFNLYLMLFFIQLIVGSVITYCLFDGFGRHVGYLNCVLITSISSLAMLISITPANLGVKEVIYVGLGVVIGVDGPLMIAVSLIDRCIQFIVLLLLTIISALSRKVRD